MSINCKVVNVHYSQSLKQTAVRGGQRRQVDLQFYNDTHQHLTLCNQQDAILQFFFDQMAELIVPYIWPKAVCLCVNQGGTNHSYYTHRYVREKGKGKSKKEQKTGK